MFDAENIVNEIKLNAVLSNIKNSIVYRFNFINKNENRKCGIYEAKYWINLKVCGNKHIKIGNTIT